MSLNDYFTKEYSVDNLIKGTKIEDAICCLIDNSLDAAEKVSKNIRIEIFLDENKFIIKDNCLGISFKEAKETVFKIGEKKSFADKYGNGLKRAILSIGKKVHIKTVKNKGVIDINLNVLENNERELWKPVINPEGNANKEDSFFITITEFTPNMKKYVTTNKKSGLFTELKNIISYKYRYKLDSNSSSINFNGEKLFPLYVQADWVCEEYGEFEGLKVNVKLFKNISDKSSNGIDFIVNDRLIKEKVKGKTIQWHKRIMANRHTYTKFYGEVIIETNDLESLGVNPSKNNINFETFQFQQVLDFMENVVEENRLAYKKPTISVQFDILEEEFNKLKAILKKQGVSFDYAKDLVEHLYHLGVNRVIELSDEKFIEVIRKSKVGKIVFNDGREHGAKEEAYEIAKRAILKGLDNETIARLTKLDINRIKALRKL
ncbi:MAG: ATP-binding protein [Clostridiaceae bacterium]